jgi:small subunit ribosomal protein S11
MFKAVEECNQKDPLALEVFFKGFGQGRDALQKALATSEGDAVRPLVITVTDRTPIKIGGTRAKKMRRL